MSDTGPDWSLFRCHGCERWHVRNGAGQKYCDACRPAASQAYRAAWNKANRLPTVDRNQTKICVCGEEFKPYIGSRGGPRLQCAKCKKRRTSEVKADWRHSPAGQASLDRQNRRRHGESVPDRRIGPR